MGEFSQAPSTASGPPPSRREALRIRNLTDKSEFENENGVYNMSKVVLLAPTPPPAGGIAGWTVRMMNATLKNGWQVEVVDEKVMGNRQVFGDGSGRNLFTEAKRCFRIWGDLKKALRDPEATVVHSCIPSITSSMLREYVCACITKRRKRKFIVHYRCTVPNTTKGRLGHFMLKKLCAKSDLIITLNSQTDDFLRGITKTPYKLIPNFISADELVESHEIRPELKTALYVGGVIETKGAYEVLELAKRFPDIQFRLVGKSDATVEQFAKDNGIDNAVFVGAKEREEVKEELAAADVFLFMTYFRGEGFSNALAEAMAAGLPCIVTDWAANRDMIGTEGGAVVGVKDVDAAETALRSMFDPDIRRAQSEANIKKVRDCYVDSVVLDMYVDAYEQVRPAAK